MINLSRKRKVKVSTRVIIQPAHKGRTKHVGALLKEVLTYFKGCKVRSQSHFPKLQFSKAIFPSYSFPNIRFPKRRHPKSVLIAVLCPLVCYFQPQCLSGPNLTFGKIPLGNILILEIVTWEVVLGKLPLGKCLWENTNTLKRPQIIIPNIFLLFCIVQCYWV